MSNCALPIINFSSFPHLKKLQTFSIQNCTTGYLNTYKEHKHDQFETIKNLSIQNTSIEQITKGQLSYFPNAEHILLAHNNIESINEDAFSTSQTIRSINLSYNSIRSIYKGTFNNLPHLKAVDLSHNGRDLCQELKTQQPGLRCLDSSWHNIGQNNSILKIIIIIIIALSLILILIIKRRRRIFRIIFSGISKPAAVLAQVLLSIQTIFSRKGLSQNDHEKTIGQIRYTENDTHKLGKNVYRGTLLNDNRKIAVKKSSINPYDKHPQELTILLQLTENTHKNVIEYICSEIEGPYRYIALSPVCDTGTLMTAVSNEQVQRCLLSCLKQLASGLKFVHHNKVQHRDIKPENILIKYQGDETTFILTDFDLGHLTGEESRKKVMYGTGGWMAPELCEEKKRDYAVDIFSLGCVFYFALTRGKKHPFGELEHLEECQIHIRDKSPPQVFIDSDISKSDISESLSEDFRREQAKDLVCQMVQFEAEERPSIERVIDHPLFWDDRDILNEYHDIGNYLEAEDTPDYADLRKYLRADSHRVYENSWINCIRDSAVSTDMKQRKKGKRTKEEKEEDICVLIREIRNKIAHWGKIYAAKDKKDSASKLVEAYKSEEGIGIYFNKIFPKLFLCTYYAKKRFKSLTSQEKARYKWKNFEV